MMTRSTTASFAGESSVGAAGAGKTNRKTQAARRAGAVLFKACSGRTFIFVGSGSTRHGLAHLPCKLQDACHALRLHALPLCPSFPVPIGWENRHLKTIARAVPAAPDVSQSNVA